jgi:hypothetical protein
MSLTEDERKSLIPGDVLIEELHGNHGCYILILTNIEHYFTHVAFLGLETYYFEGVATRTVLRKVSFIPEYERIRKL